MRPRIPDEKKKLTGTWRKDRSNDDSPKGTLLISPPDPPEYLSQRAQDFWTHICTEFIKMNILQDIDTHLLEVACNEMDNYWKYDQELKKGIMRMSMSGEFKEKPEVKLKDKAFEKAYRILAKFGLTPSDRLKLKTGPPKKENKSGGIFSHIPKIA